MKKINNHGSALVWVLIICVIFGILGVAIGSVALSMNNRSIKNNSRQQAYFTARSGVDAVFSYLNGDKQKYEFSQYLYENLIKEPHEFKIDNLFSDPRIEGNVPIEGLGQCTVSGTYKSGIITLKAVAKVAEQEVTVSLEAERQKGDRVWPSKKWAMPLQTSKTSTMDITVGKVTDEKKYNVQNAADFLVYVVDQSDNTVKKGILNIQEDKENPKQAIFIYIKDNQTLEINGIEGWSEEYGPDIFIYVGGSENNDVGSQLILDGQSTQNKPYPFYIFAEENSRGVSAKSGSSAKVYYLNQKSDSVTYEKEGDNLKNPAKSNYESSITKISDTNGAQPALWKVKKYYEPE